jgi:cytochrome c oxidase subunit IV
MHSPHDIATSDRNPATAYGHYVLIWIGLVALTALTVALAGISLGRWVIFTALTIAGIKSTMVLFHFMHLRSEDRVFRIFVLAAILTLVIFVVLTFFDYAFR